MLRTLQEKLLKIYDQLALPIIMAVAISVRAFGVGFQGVSLDESYSIFYAFSEGWWISIFWDNHPPLYYLVLHYWLCLFPLSDVAARWLSILFSTLGVFLFYELGRLIGGKRLGLRMALLLCFSAISIRFAREARMYALFELLSIALGCTLYLCWSKPNFANYFKLGFTSLIIACTHSLGFVVAFIAYAILLVRKKLAFFAFGISLLLAVPALLYFIKFNSNSMVWQADHFIFSDINGVLTSFLLEFCQGSEVLVAIVVTTVVGFSFGLIAKYRNFAFLGWIVLLVVSAAIFFSFKSHRSVLVPRYYIFLNPILLLILALSIDILPFLARMIFVLAYCYGFTQVYSMVKPHWRDAAEYVQKQGGQLVLTTKSVGIQMPYYRANHIPVDRVKLDASFVTHIQERQKDFKNIWFVDSADDLNSIELSSKLLREKDIKFELIPFPIEAGSKQESGEQLVYAIHII